MVIDGDDPLQTTRPKNNVHYFNQATNNKGHGDIVEVLQIPVGPGLLERLHEYSDQGVVVDSRVFAFAMGMSQAQRLLKSDLVLETEAPM